MKTAPRITPLDNSTILQGYLDRLALGDEQAVDHLINCACIRLTKLTRKMLNGFPALRRWEETDDVFQNVMIRLSRALKQSSPERVADFFGLAARHIRYALIDLARHYFGPQGMGKHHHSDAENPQAENVSMRGNQIDEPGQLAIWTEFHAKVEKLPTEQREVFDLLWYQGLSQSEAATCLSTSERTVQRRWRDACLTLYRSLKGSPTVIPESHFECLP